MRYLVRFIHRKYLEIVKRLVAESGYRIPEGVYRELSVVVEAESASEALREACASIVWPEEEIQLVPVEVVSHAEAMASLDKIRNAQAVLRLWAEMGLGEGFDGWRIDEPLLSGIVGHRLGGP